MVVHIFNDVGRCEMEMIRRDEARRKWGGVEQGRRYWQIAAVLLCVGALKGVGKDGLEWGGGSGVERELWFEFYSWFFGSCVALMEIWYII